MTVSIQFLLLTVLALVGCIIVFVTIYTRLRQQYDALHSSYRDLERLNSDLRAQRHDYLNHLQVVYGLMELEEYDELKTYLAPIYKGMMKTGKALKTRNPAVNALLRAKMEEAESKGIDFYVEVSSDLSGLTVEPWELCKVLANLMDNAIDFTPRGGTVTLFAREEEKNVVIGVRDTGCGIEPKDLPMIWERFYKADKSRMRTTGTGLGLTIAKLVVECMGGKIGVKSEPGKGAEFEFSLMMAEK